MFDVGDEEGPDPQLLVSLLRAVALFAAPAESQQRWAATLGERSWESTINEFRSGYSLVPLWVRAGWLDDFTQERLGELDAAVTTWRDGGTSRGFTDLDGEPLVAVRREANEVLLWMNIGQGVPVHLLHANTHGYQWYS